ncbi:ABC transporter ATP-binding protein [Streptococcus pneumoniae]|nr:ABC transporter ATP-binding protein [Streptococcus pneumoniae]
MTVVKVEKLSKKIKDKEILRNISFEINDGECVALIGPNGAGKTTLLDCLLGDKLVTSGQVSIQGLPVTSSKLDYTRAYLPQENVIVQKLKVNPNHSYLSQLDVTYKTPDLMSHFLPPHEVSFTFCCSSIVFPR